MIVNATTVMQIINNVKYFTFGDDNYMDKSYRLTNNSNILLRILAKVLRDKTGYEWGFNHDT